MNSYDFPVELAPIKANNIVIPKKVAVIRTDTNKPVGVVSNLYGLLKHKDVVDSFREALSNQRYEEKIEVIKDGAHLFATYKLPEIQYEVKKGDFVAMQFVAKNSYDGTKSFSLMLGALRLVCLNGMVIGKEFFSYTQRHISAGITFVDTGNLKDRISELISHFKNSIPVMTQMSNTKLDLSNESLFDDNKLLIPKYLLTSAKEIFEKRADDSVWEYYNSLTYAISHNLKKDRPQTKIDYTKRAWTIASELLNV